MLKVLSLCRTTKSTSDILAKSLKNLFINSKMSYYAVAKGRQEGIFGTWAECESQVKGFGGARYKKFKSKDEALQFISENGGSVPHYGSKNSKPMTNYNNITSNYNKPTTSKVYTNKNVSSFKKPYTDYTAYKNKNVASFKKPDRTSKQTMSSEDDYSDEDLSDDDFPDQKLINELIIKEMDKVEKRVNAVKKSVDKIYSGQTKSSNVSKTQKRTMMIDAPKRQSSSNEDGPSMKRRKISNIEFETDDNDYVQVYTDGSCIGNGTRSARAGLGVYFGNDHPLNVCSPVSGRATNNCGEIQAATKAIRLAHQSGVKKLQINTDSQFLINSATQWMKAWKRKGWKLSSGEPVKNEVDFKELDSVLPKLDVKFNYVKAHVGIHGNEMADKLANEGAAMYRQK